MNRIWKWQIAAASLCAALMPLTSAFAQEERDDVYKVYREMRTMALVLGEVLDRNDLLEGPHGLIGASPFDAQVESTYTPSVGLTFNVSVRFPIEEPDSPPEAPVVEPVDPNEDLWERFTRSRSDSDRGRDGDRDAGRSERPGPPQQPDRGGPGGGPGGPGGGPGGPGGGPGGPEGSRWAPEMRFGSQAFEQALRVVQESYDAAKVEKLQNVIVETLAKYGHELEHIPADERIIVVVDAPKTRSKFYRRASDADRARALGSLTPGARAESEVRVFQQHGARDPMVFGMTDFGDMPWLRDHMLLSVSRGDLTEGVTPDALAAKIRNVRY